MQLTQKDELNQQISSSAIVSVGSPDSYGRSIEVKFPVSVIANPKSNVKINIPLRKATSAKYKSKPKSWDTSALLTKVERLG